MTTLKEDITSILFKWLDDISLVENGELETNRDLIQHVIKEKYTTIPYSVYEKMIVMRTHALESYGASNHIKIPALENIDRAIRHIHCTVGTPSDIGGTQSNELIHSIFRIYMGLDGLYDKIGTVEYEDWADTKKMYALNEKCNPNLTLFPSSVRRALIILNSDDDLCKLVNSIDMTNVYNILDLSIDMLFRCIHDKFEGYNQINGLLIVSILLIYCSSVLNDNNK